MFVYGTLRRRFQGSHSRILAASAEFVGEGTVGGFDMRLAGNIPMVVRGSGTVVGDVYAMPPPGVARIIDDYEDVGGGLYAREEADALVSGKYVRCAVYVGARIAAWNGSVALPDGDYLRYVERSHVT